MSAVTDNELPLAAAKLPVIDMVSVVVPVYRSTATLPELCSRLAQILDDQRQAYEIVLVDDDGRPEMWQVIEQIVGADNRVRGLRMRRNYGQHNALLCGIRAARGSVVVTIDDDLQNPPEEMPRLLEALGDDEIDVVYGRPQRGEFSLWRKLASRATKRALRLSGVFAMADSVSSFRAFRTELREVFDQRRAADVNIDVLLSWCTDRYAEVVVRHDPRREGRSAYSVWRLVRHALNMITGFSVTPLKLASLLGFATAALGFAVMTYVLGLTLFVGRTVPGFAFIASTVALFAGVQLFAIGIIGEYLGRLYLVSMGRPSYSVRDEVDAIDLGRSRPSGVQSSPDRRVAPAELIDPPSGHERWPAGHRTAGPAHRG